MQKIINYLKELEMGFYERGSSREVYQKESFVVKIPVAEHYSKLELYDRRRSFKEWNRFFSKLGINNCTKIELKEEELNQDIKLNYGINQSVSEIFLWESIKNTELSKFFCKIDDYFTLNGLVITVMEKVQPLEQLAYHNEEYYELFNFFMVELKETLKKIVKSEEHLQELLFDFCLMNAGVDSDGNIKIFDYGLVVFNKEVYDEEEEEEEFQDKGFGYRFE